MATSSYQLQSIKHEFQANTRTVGDQDLKGLAGFDSGGFAVGYQNQMEFWNPTFRTATPVTLGGAMLSGGLANSDNGTLLAAWESGGQQFASRYNMYGAKIGGDIAFTHPSQLAAGSTLNTYFAIGDDGSFVRVIEGNSGREANLLFQRFNAAGTLLSNSFIDTVADGFYGHPGQVVRLKDGGHVVVFENTTALGSNFNASDVDIRAVVVNANGSIRKRDFFVAGSEGGDHFYESDDHVFVSPQAAALPTGGFAVVYMDKEVSDIDGNRGVWLDVFRANGELERRTIVQSWQSDNADDQNFIKPQIAVLKNGFIAVSWTQNPLGADKVYGRIFDADGETLFGAANGKFLVSDGDVGFSDLAATTDGRFVTAWADPNDGSGTGVMAEVFGVARRTVGNDLAEVIRGDALDDEVTAAHGDDTVYGGGGNDSVDGGGGRDTIYGGDDNDFLSGGADGDILNGDGGADLLLGDEGNDAISGGSGDDLINGGEGGDGIRGDEGNDILQGGFGADQDYLTGGAGKDSLSGGDGDDDYFLSDVYYEGPVNEARALAPSPVRGQYFYDAVVEAADQGTDTVHLTRFTSGPSGYTLGANVENARIAGGGSFALTGNGLGNALTGHSGNDTLNGLDGDDHLFGFAGRDTLDGGQGSDTADYSDKVSTVTVTLNGSTYASVTVNGSTQDSIRNIENLVGGSGDDRFAGDGQSNILNGGMGLDTLTGGSGGDRFVFTTALNRTTNVDTILDFYAPEDSIRLDDAIFAGLAPGMLAASAFKDLRDGPLDASDRIFYGESGTLYYDPDGSGSLARTEFAFLGPGTPITHHDFLVI